MLQNHSFPYKWSIKYIYSKKNKNKLKLKNDHLTWCKNSLQVIAITFSVHSTPTVVVLSVSLVALPFLLLFLPTLYCSHRLRNQEDFFIACRFVRPALLSFSFGRREQKRLQLFIRPWHSSKLLPNQLPALYYITTTVPGLHAWNPKVAGTKMVELCREQLYVCMETRP